MSKINQIKRLAIIPARGGSKRIPNKNIRSFCGNPIIHYSLRALKNSGLFDLIHVSTESKTICDVVTQLGFPPDFLRPSELADDFTSIMPVMRFVAEEYMRRAQIFDEIWLIMACAPLIQSEDLIGAARLFHHSSGCNPVVAVSEYEAPIEWAFKKDENGFLIPVQPGMFAKRSQDLTKHYFDAGCFSIFPSNAVIESEGAGSDCNFLGYILPRESAIDIDDESDWRFAEIVFQSKFRQGGNFQ